MLLCSRFQPIYAYDPLFGHSEATSKSSLCHLSAALLAKTLLLASGAHFEHLLASLHRSRASHSIDGMRQSGTSSTRPLLAANSALGTSENSHPSSTSKPIPHVDSVFDKALYIHIAF